MCRIRIPQMTVGIWLWAWIGIVFSALGQQSLPIAHRSPDDGQTVIGRRPEIVITLDANAGDWSAGQVYLTVDGMDVTSQVDIDGHTLRYRPAMDLQPGTHRVEVIVTDATGDPVATSGWTFYTRDLPFLQKADLQIRLSESFRRTVARENETVPAYVSQGNIGWQLDLSEGQFGTVSNGNVFVMDQEGPGTGSPTGKAVDLSNWTTRVTVGETFVEGGDVAVQLGELLTGGGFARRGVQGRITFLGTEVRLFRVDPQPVLGFRNLLGLQDPNRRVQGIALAHALLPDELLWLQVTYLEGEEQTVNAYSIGSLEGVRSGRSYGVLARTRWFQGRVTGEAEYVFSRMDDDVLDPFPQEGDRAWRVQFNARFGRLDLQGRYRIVGARFGSLANPGLPNDRAEAFGSVQLDFRPVRVGGTFHRQWDNLSRDVTRPRMVENLMMHQ